MFRIALSRQSAARPGRRGADGTCVRRHRRTALFVAGFSLQSASLQRVFAIIKLLRAVAAFMVAPILAHFAVTASSDLNVGTGYALWIGFGLAIGGALFGVAIYALSGARPQRPNLDRFIDGESPAWYSPPLLARIRSDLPSPVAAAEYVPGSHDFESS